eukprot:gene29701-35852_t
MSQFSLPVESAIESGVLNEVDLVRKEAEGCRLQGGSQQLIDAMLRINCALSTLEGLKNSCGAASKWKVVYSQCLLEQAVIYGEQENMIKAEALARDAFQIFSAMLVDVEKVSGRISPTFAVSHEQFLGLIHGTIKDVYFRAADCYANEAQSYLLKAAAILNWYSRILMAVDSNVVQHMEESSHLADGVEMIAVNDLFMYLISRNFPFLSSKRAVLCKLLSIASAINVRLQDNQAAVRIYETALDLVEPDSLVGEIPDDDEQSALDDIRRGYVRCALQCCDKSQSIIDSDARMRMLTSVESMLGLLRQPASRRDAELWGDLFRLKGGSENEVLSFCIYVACYKNHCCGDNRDMVRLAAKMNNLESAVLPHLDSWCIARDGGLFYIKFLLREEVVDVFKEFLARKVAIKASKAKVEAVRLLQRDPKRFHELYQENRPSLKGSGRKLGSSASSVSTSSSSSTPSSSLPSSSLTSPASSNLAASSEHVPTVDYDKENPHFVNIDGVSMSLEEAASESFPYFIHGSRAVYGTILHLALMQGHVLLSHRLGRLAIRLRAQDVSRDFSTRRDSHNFTVDERCSHFKSSFAMTLPYFGMTYYEGQTMDNVPQWTFKEQLFFDFLQGSTAKLDTYSCEALSTPLYYYWSYGSMRIYGTLLHFSLYHALRDKACYLMRRRVSESVPDSDNFSILGRINDPNPAARVWVAGLKAEYDMAKSAAAAAILQDFEEERYNSLEEADYLSTDHLVGWCNAVGEMFASPDRGRHEVRGTLLHYALLRRLKPQLRYLKRIAEQLQIQFADIEDSDLVTPFQRSEKNASFKECMEFYLHA